MGGGREVVGGGRWVVSDVVGEQMLRKTILNFSIRSTFGVDTRPLIAVRGLEALPLERALAPPPPPPPPLLPPRILSRAGSRSVSSRPSASSGMRMSRVGIEFGIGARENQIRTGEVFGYKRDYL